MRKKNVIVMIFMIIGFFVLFNVVQLSAEEVVGKSIFTKIETPHPYEVPTVGKTLVWTKTIDQPGAAWIKIHFSQFRLNEDDYVNLRDMNGKLIEQIKGKDISRQTKSKFNVKKDVEKSVNGFNRKDEAGRARNDFNTKKDIYKTFSFWGPAADGDKITIELYSTSNTKKNLGFNIDEIGIGCQDILEKDMKPIIKENEKIDMSIHPFWKNNPKMSLMGFRGNPVDIVSIPKGKMLYRKNGTWYTCEGSLDSKRGTQFFPGDTCLDSRDILDTLEVRFFLEYTTKKNVKNIPGYYTYYCYSVVEAESNHFITQIRLRNDNQMFSLDRKIGSQIGNNDDNLSGIYEVAADYDPEDEEKYKEWEEEGFDPPLGDSTDTSDPVIRNWVLAPDNNNNWYEIESVTDNNGNLAKVGSTLKSEPGGNPCSTSNEISRTSYCSRCYCCWVQYMICNLMHSVFWWRPLDCYWWYYYCRYYNLSYHCSYYFGPWGMYWRLYYWYGFGW